MSKKVPTDTGKKIAMLGIQEDNINSVASSSDAATSVFTSEEGNGAAETPPPSPPPRPRVQLSLTGDPLQDALLRKKQKDEEAAAKWENEEAAATSQSSEGSYVESEQPAVGRGNNPEVNKGEVANAFLGSENGTTVDSDIIVWKPNMSWSMFFASERFDHLMGAVIFLNIMVMAVEYSFAEDAVDAQMREWAIMDLVFLGIYTFELAIKHTTRTWKALTKDKAMFALDWTIVLMGAVTELLVPLMQGTFLSNTQKKTQAMQMLKMARILRAVRILRILALFDEMRRMMLLTQTLMIRMIWLAIFELMVAFLFAMFSVVLIGQNLQDETPPNPNPTTDEELKLNNAWFLCQEAVRGFAKTSTAWYNMWLLEQGLRDGVAFDIMTYSFQESQYTWVYVFFVGIIAMGRISLFLVVQALLIVDGLDKIMVLDSEDGARKWKQDIRLIKRTFDFEYDPTLDVKFLAPEDFEIGVWESKPFLEVLTTMGARKYDIPYLYPYCFNMSNTRAQEKVSGGVDLLNEPRVTQKEFLYIYCKLRKLCEDPSFIGAMKISNSSQERVYHMCVNAGVPVDKISEIPPIPDPDDEGRTTEKGDPDGKPLNLIGQLKIVRGEKLELHPRFYDNKQKLVMSGPFNGGIGFVVIVNCFLMAYEYELHEEDQKEMYLTFVKADLFFLVIFAGEVWLRQMAFGWTFLLSHVMTSLDLFIVVSGVATELVLPILFGKFLVNTAKEEDEEGGGGNTDMLKLLKVFRVIRAVRILKMLDFFEGLYRAMSTFMDSVFILFWPMLYFFCVNYLFTLVTIFMIGRNSVFDTPRPVDTCGGCSEYHFRLDQWHKLNSAVAQFSQFHTSFSGYFRMAFFSSDQMLFVIDNQKWTFLYFMVYVYIVRLAILMAFYSILQDMIIKDTDAEKFMLKVDEMVVNINRMMRNVLIGMDVDEGKLDANKFQEDKGGQAYLKDRTKNKKGNVDHAHKTRMVSRSAFSQGYHHSPQFCKMQEFLRLADEDYGLIFDVVDVYERSEISVPELVNLFRLMKFMVADSAVAVRIQNSDLQKQRLYIIENYLKSRQVAVV